MEWSSSTTRGPRAAALKGSVLKWAAKGDAGAPVQVVDVTHSVPADWPVEAGHWVQATYTEFPSGSVHLVAADPGRGTERDILVAAHDGHLFVGYDNGVLDPLLGSAPKVRGPIPPPAGAAPAMAPPVRASPPPPSPP